jgi:hypothetical protein
LEFHGGKQVRLMFLLYWYFSRQVTRTRRILLPCDCCHVRYEWYKS